MNEFCLHDHKHNLKYNLAHEFFWGFGVAFHTVYAISPLFLRELGAPESIVVSTAGFFAILIALPTLFIAVFGRNIQNIKGAVLKVHLLIIIVSFLMGLTFSFIDPIIIKSAWKIYFIYFLLYAFAIGIIVPIWAEFLNQSTLKSERGKFFGLGFACNSLGSFMGGFALKYLLKSSIPFPRNFGIGFMILCLCLLIGTILFIFFRMKPMPNNYKNKTISIFLSEMKMIILKHKNFQKYILSRIFFTAHLSGIGIYAIYAQNKFDFDISEAGIFTILNVIASGWASYLVGKLGDKTGHKMGMLLAYFSHFIALLLSVFALNMLWVYGIFIAIGLGQGAFMPSAMNLIYDFADNYDSKTYMALTDSFLAPFVLLFMIIISSLVNSGHYLISFFILGCSIFLSIVLLIFFVKDPRQHQENSFRIKTIST